MASEDNVIPLVIPKKSTVRISLELFEDEQQTQPTDLTGATSTGAVGSAFNDPTPQAYTITFTDRLNGKVDYELSETETEALDFGVFENGSSKPGVHDALIRLQSGDIVKPFTGPVELEGTLSPIPGT